MSMVDMINKYAPNYWCPFDGDQKQVPTHSEEYQQILFELQTALEIPRVSLRTVKKIIRIQNKHDFGQCLVREQLLTAANKNITFYRVRRYTKLKEAYLDQALTFNLDHRRCGLKELILHKFIPIQQVLPGEVVIIVQVITAFPDTDQLSPKATTDYFIEYVVHL